MAEENRVEVEFGANTDELKDKVKEAADVVKEGMQGLGDSVKPAEVATVALGVALNDLAKWLVNQVGDAIQKSITRFSELGSQVEHLQRRIGGSAQDVSALRVGLDAVGISTSQFESVALRLGPILENNEDKFKKAGIAVRDSSGNMLSTQKILQNLMTHMDKFAAGSARNAEAAALGLGLAWRSMIDLVEMTPDRMREAEESARNFGLVMSKDDVAASSEFRFQVELLNIELEGFYAYIGRAVTPALTRLVELLREDLVPAFNAFKFVIEVCAIFVAGLWNGLVILAAVLGGLWSTLTTTIALVDALGMALSGSPLKALEYAKSTIAQYKATIGNLGGWVADEIRRTNAALERLSAGPGKGEPDSGNKGGTKGEDGSGGKKTPEADRRLQLWRTELRDKLVAEGEFFKSSLKEEIGFWENKLNLIKTNSEKDKKLRADVKSILFDLKKKEAQEQLDLTIDHMKREAEAYREGSVERIRIAGETAAMIGAVYGLESREYRKALDDMTAAARERQEEQEKLDEISRNRIVEHSLWELNVERAHIDELKSLGQLKDVDALARLRNLKEREYAILVQAKRDEIALMEIGSVAQAEAYAKLEEMADAHALEMQQIAMRIGEAERAAIDKWLAPITEAFDRTILGIIQGTQTLEDGFKNLFQSIVLEFQKMCLDIIKEWIKTQIQLQIQQNMASGGGGFFGSMLSGLMGISGAGGGAGSFLVDGVPNGLTAAAYLPPLLASGTSYVPRDMLAVIHKGEAVIPAEMNRAGKIGGMSVVNNFTVSGSVDTRTQRQIGMMAAQALTAAQMRNG